MLSIFDEKRVKLWKYYLRHRAGIVSNTLAFCMLGIFDEKQENDEITMNDTEQELF